MAIKKRLDIGFFDILSDIFQKKGLIYDNPEKVQSVLDESSQWVINRYLSFCPKADYVVCVNYLQKYWLQLEPLQYLKLLYTSCPKVGYQFVKYIKKNKETVSKNDELIIEMIQDYYSCSKVQAAEYQELLDDKQIIELASAFGERYAKLLKEEKNGRI